MFFNDQKSDVVVVTAKVTLQSDSRPVDLNTAKTLLTEWSSHIIALHITLKR